MNRDEFHLDFITIDPNEHSIVYIAYSEFIWAEEIFKKNSESPEARMQKIDIEKWISSNQQESATIVSKESIESILDYDIDFFDIISDQNKVNLIPKMRNKLGSEEQEKNDLNFKLEDEFLKFFGEKPQTGDEILSSQNEFRNLSSVADFLAVNSTLHGYSPFNYSAKSKQQLESMHQVKSETLIHTMKRYSDNNSPMIIAVEDSIGVAEELNGFYHDAIHRMALLYEDEKSKLRNGIVEIASTLNGIVSSEKSKNDMLLKPFFDEDRDGLVKDTRFGVSTNIFLDIYYQKLIKYKTIGDCEDEEYRNYLLYEEHLKVLKKGRYGEEIWGPNAKYDVFTPPLDFPRSPLIDKLKSPNTRNIYHLINSYRLIVKNYFNGKPNGSEYSRRFYKELFDNPILGTWGWGAKLAYYSNEDSIEFHKPNVFDTEDARCCAKELYSIFVKLVEEYESKNKQEEEALESKITERLKDKYLKKLPKKSDIDKYNAQVNELVKVLTEKRAETLIDYVNRSQFIEHYKDITCPLYIDINDIPENNELIQKIKNEFALSYANDIDGDVSEDDFLKFDLNQFLYQQVFVRVFDGIDSTEVGGDFFASLVDMEMLSSFDFNIDVYKDLNPKMLAIRFLFNHPQLGMKIMGDLSELYIKMKSGNNSVQAIFDITKDISPLLIDMNTLSKIALSMRIQSIFLEYVDAFNILKDYNIAMNIGARVPEYRVFKLPFRKYPNLGKFNIEKGTLSANLVNKHYESMMKLGRYVAGKGFSAYCQLIDVVHLMNNGVKKYSAITIAYTKYQLGTLYALYSKGVSTKLPVSRKGFHSVFRKQLIKLKASYNMAIELIDYNYKDLLHLKPLPELVDERRFFGKKLFKLFDTSGIKNNKLELSEMRSKRLGILLGTLELASWGCVIKKAFNSEWDEAVVQELLMTTVGLTASAFDLASIFDKKNRFLSFAFCRRSFAILSSVDNMITSFKLFSGSNKQFERGNYFSFVLGMTSSVGYGVSSVRLLMLSQIILDKPWLKLMAEGGKKIAIKVSGRFVSAATLAPFITRMLARIGGRVFFYIKSGYIFIVSMILEFLYEYFKDDAVQEFLVESFAGSSAKYYNAKDQKEAFEKAVFGDEDESKTSQVQLLEEQICDLLEKANMTHEDVMIKAESFINEWLPANYSIHSFYEKLDSEIDIINL